MGEESQAISNGSNISDGVTSKLSALFDKKYRGGEVTCTSRRRDNASRTYDFAGTSSSIRRQSGDCFSLISQQILSAISYSLLCRDCNVSAVFIRSNIGQVYETTTLLSINKYSNLTN